MSTFESLKARGKRLEEHSVALADWMKTHLPEEGNQGSLRELELIGRELRSLQRAVENPASVVMFGQSQVGKSYLIHNIAKNRTTDRLEIKGGAGEVVDFIKDINPIGEGSEATGVVTRFKVGESTGNADFPFEAKLLSQLDIAAIAANSYNGDLTGQPADSIEKIRSVFESLPALSAQPIAGMNEDEIAYFIDYCRSRFSGAAYIAALDRAGYFEEVQKTLLFLTDNQRLKVLSLLWGGVPFWSEFVEQAWRALAKLGHSRHAFLSRESVSPNSHTVVGVSRIYEQYDQELHSTAYSPRQQGVAPPAWEVAVKTEGKVSHINRGMLSVLIREVTLPIDFSIASEDRQFLNECDLLDFPGARSRKVVQESTFREEPDVEHIVRGKVAYLFDLYNRELEIGVLVLCVHKDQSNVTTLPLIVNEWISRNCGPSSEIRLNRRQHLEGMLQGKVDYDVKLSPLLTAFTKFNLNMLPANEHAEVGANSIAEGFSNRFKKNFELFFEGSVSDKWISKWDDQPYRFVFPIRDPQWSGRIFEGYTKESPFETQVRSEVRELLGEMEKEFVGNLDVQRLLEDPREVWRELTTPNSSGMSSFMKHLAPVAHPAIKISTVHTKLEEFHERLLRLAEPHFRSGDISEELKKARAKGSLARISLGAMMNRNVNLVIRLMEEFMCREEDAQKAYYDVYRELVNPELESDITWQQVSEVLGVSLPGDADNPASYLAHQIGLELEEFVSAMADQDIQLPPIEQGVMHVEKHERFAKLLIMNWFRRVSEWRSEELLIKSGGTANQAVAVAAIIEALELGVERTRLKELVASEVEMEFAQPAPSNDAAVSASALSTRLVNRYARSCGWEMVEGEHPERSSGGQIFHQNQVAIASRDEIRPHQTGPSTYWEDWVLGLQKSFEENVKHTFNVQDPSFITANDKLGDLIESIEQTAP